MKKMLLFSAVVFFYLTTNATTVAIDSIPADPKDVSSPEAIVAAVYDVISGPAGQKRNWDRMRTLFAPDARMIPTGKRSTGESTRRTLAVEDYITNFRSNFWVLYIFPVRQQPFYFITYKVSYFVEL